jgi:hypothetical protein
MKNFFFEILFIFASILSFGQDVGFGYLPDPNPTQKMEKLSGMKTLQDLHPDFCRFLILPGRQQILLDDHLNRKKLFYSTVIRPLGSYLQKRNYVQQDFDRMVQYLSVEVIATRSGKITSMKGTNEKLTADQRNLLLAADPEMPVKVKIRFTYKTPLENAPEAKSEINEGEFQVRLVPEVQAEFPGGEKQLDSYLKNRVSDRITRNGENLNRVRIQFYINERGEVEKPILAQNSADPKTDKIILEAIQKMPKWKPARDSKGKPTKQNFTFTFGFEGC